MYRVSIVAWDCNWIPPFFEDGEDELIGLVDSILDGSCWFYSYRNFNE